MTFLKNNISILNWVDTKFNLERLIDLKEDEDELNKVIQSLSKQKQDELKKLCKSIKNSLQHDYKLICVTGEQYPEPLKRVFSCPVPLMYKGSLNLESYTIGVVGSRKPQETTTEWLQTELHEALMQLKNTNKSIHVFSGGAYGVDQLAHKVSLLSGVATTCFLPTGVNQCYPKSLIPLTDNIIANGGAIISPFPPDFPIYKSNFYFRNKILVLLSDFMFIAEARRRSGTIMTANMALSSGKPMVALPQAPIKNCLGSIDLIESGVPLVRCQKDLMRTVMESGF